MNRHPLLSAETLASRVDRVRPVDVRWYLTEPDRGRSEYEAGHIPGAVFADLDGDLSAPPGPGRHPLPSPAAFARTLAGWGIDTTTPVVAYDDSGGGIAARLWWMLRAIGHNDVAVLDGGWSAWTRMGLPTTSQPATIRACPPRPVTDRWPGTIGRAELAATRANRPVVDARARERFRGDNEPVDPRAGHIPGAINIPHTDTIGPDGLHLQPDRLAERFAEVGTGPVVYCGSGVNACHDLLAMAAAGRFDGVLYPGSWSDWSSEEALPIETGG